MEVTVFEAKDLINVKETKTKLPGTKINILLNVNRLVNFVNKISFYDDFFKLF